jgi:hypothetical protein
VDFGNELRVLDFGFFRNKINYFLKKPMFWAPKYLIRLSQLEASKRKLVWHRCYLFVIRVVLLLIVMFYILFMCKCVLPPGVNPIAVDKYINIKCNLRSLSPFRLADTNIFTFGVVVCFCGRPHCSLLA